MHYRQISLELQIITLRDTAWILFYSLAFK
jgi:hypothetical protein